ncbi:Transcriptional regulator of nonfermentable carbon utilization [Vermiconidia calcicola]|uniref:Transcriptional regulator of nonfermentable carbon utilization n=1 Tax=Vermiconidia calcicola TaxID=1690605 RepID=A0ACC3NHW7_9PEZI|nr:Transcriptional regulator of nonfermentable carbon utilization [Vermiconidia calcicola]
MSPDAIDELASPEPGSEQDYSIMAEEKNERSSTEEKTPERASSDSKSTAKSNAKDPSRPRRKKARRACFACQRAHLTCGDERPCLRCIKRGLQDQCHDGVRKKAKYLHDAPTEALMPGFTSNYHLSGSHSMPSVAGVATVGGNGMPVSQSGNYYQNLPGSYPLYSPTGQQTQMTAQMMDNTNLVGDMPAPTNVSSPTQFQSTSRQQLSPIQDIPPTMDQSSTLGSAGNPSFDSAFFDPNDPSLYNFNISDLNFGNHYGALEFGMLGQMSGALNTPDVEALGSMGQQHAGSLSYDSTAGYPAANFPYNQRYQPWQTAQRIGSRQGSTTNLWALQNNGTDAFAVADTTASIPGASPHSSSQDFSAGYQSQTVSPETQFVQPDQSHQQTELLRQSLSQAQQQTRKQAPFPNDVGQTGFKKRRRDTSEIYSSVHAPYPYTQGFHGLTAFLQKRFPSNKVLRIAKALASIRPSFISCNKNLNHDDLIFMEKCFQRTVWEYEDFIASQATPTVIFRRTGEVAAINKEFSLVTGWRRDVLLGKEPNLNINTGSNSSSGTQTGSSTRGAVTPRMPQVDNDPGRPQPVFLAELLDPDSVVQFYEDFAELAFGASRASIIGTSCSLIMYKTKDDPGWGPEDRLTEDGERIKKQNGNKTEPLMKSEAGVNAFGDRDGKIEASMCWTVKRDVFDIPMLIVMNFLPVV